MNFSIENIELYDSSLFFLMYDEFTPSSYTDALTDQEVCYFNNIRHLKRQREYIATRILRNSVFGKKTICYNEIGAPYIEGGNNISVSHSENTIGIAVNNSFKIGLDLETITPKAQRLHEKFLNEEEMENFDTSSATEMTKCWSAKEALYKLADRNGIDFRQELLIYKDAENWGGKIVNDTYIYSVDLHLFEFNNQIVTINTNKTERHER